MTVKGESRQVERMNDITITITNDTTLYVPAERSLLECSANSSIRLEIDYSDCRVDLEDWAQHLS